MSVITRLMNGSPVGAVGAKLIGGSPVASVDAELDRIRAGAQADAAALADAHAAKDVLITEMKRLTDAGLDTTEIFGRIEAADIRLRHVALRVSMHEKNVAPQIAVLEKKKFRLRVGDLDQSEATGREKLAVLDEGIIEDLLRVSEKFGRREKLAFDLFGTCARTQHLTGLPKGMGNLAWDEAPLVSEFCRRHPEARRTMPFGEAAWGPFTLTLPVMSPDRVTEALVLDDLANAST